MKTLLSTLTLASAFLLVGVLAGEARADAPVEAETSSAHRVAVGEKAPPAVLTATDGTVRDSTKVEDGKSLVMVFFRGAW